jgi:anti-sigma factor RsiW
MNHPDVGHDHRCAGFLERLSRYLDDELPAADRRTIEGHLSDCPCCEEVLESLRFTVAICHEEGRPDLPADVRQRARARVSELLRHAPPTRARAR